MNFISSHAARLLLLSGMASYAKCIMAYIESSPRMFLMHKMSVTTCLGTITARSQLARQASKLSTLTELLIDHDIITVVLLTLNLRLQGPLSCKVGPPEVRMPVL